MASEDLFLFKKFPDLASVHMTMYNGIVELTVFKFSGIVFIIYFMIYLLLVFSVIPNI